MPTDSPLASADGSTPVAPVTPYGSPIELTGTLGNHLPPVLVSVVGSDPDNGDDLFTNNDIITLTFDRATYIGRQGVTGSVDPFRTQASSEEGGGGGGGGGGMVYAREAVDALFEFDFYQLAESEARVPSLGLDYEGQWVDDSTFVITVTNAVRQVGRDAADRIWTRMPGIDDNSYMANNYMAKDSIWARVIGDVRSLGLQSPPCTDRVPLVGNWGERLTKPTIVKLFGTDPDNGDALPSAGDTLTIVFDRTTSQGRTAQPRPPAPRTKAFADFFLTFTPPIGDEYVAEFVDLSTFVVTVVSGNAEWAEAEEPRTVRVKPQAQIKNSAATSNPANDVVELSGTTWGHPGAPNLLSAVVSDYDHFNALWSGGDEIRLTFDRATDEGTRGGRGGRRYVDGLFGFDHYLGDDYSGEWVDRSSLRRHRRHDEPRTAGGRRLAAREQPDDPQRRRDGDVLRGARRALGRLWRDDAHRAAAARLLCRVRPADRDGRPRGGRQDAHHLQHGHRPRRRRTLLGAFHLRAAAAL